MSSVSQVTFLLATAAAALAQPRFDMVVRNDFFAGFAGDRDALDRAMKISEEVLAAEPKHAEAMVWHGSGVFFRSGEAAKNKDFVQAATLYQRGLDEMSAAVALAPGNVAVLIPRGATLLTASRNVPADMGRQLLKTGLEDYETVYRLQAKYFDKLSGHARGELLFGLAEGYLRQNDEPRAREWFEKLAAVTDPENGHLRQARMYLETNSLTGTRNCAGCHVAK